MTNAPAGERAGQPRPPSLGTVVREWGRIGCIGFGGPPTHIKLLRELCVERRAWMDPAEFEDAIAACNLLPGPASTQLALFCAWRVRGRRGALLGGLAFIIPGLILILALAELFLADAPPRWILGAGAGAGSAVAAVAIRAGSSLVGSSWERRRSRLRWAAFIVAGATAAASSVGPLLVLVLVGCGLIEMSIRRATTTDPNQQRAVAGVAMLATAGLGLGVLLDVSWVALKVGALSYGGGFVIIPLMQHDAVDLHHWMSAGQFLDAVALGQITPGPVVQTVAAVGYAAAGLGGGLLAAAVVFAPSFAFVLCGAPHFDRLRNDNRASAFLGGAGPAAIGAILGSAIPLARALDEPWQYAVLAGAAATLLVLRRSVVFTLAAAGVIGVLVALVGGPLPR